ncbi:MAG: ATP-binding cassette domain-containing protein [Trichlorobacter sp.]|nr:ATP-binding cassette domain-containing protein [Trichlorobacter sp.]
MTNISKANLLELQNVSFSYPDGSQGLHNCSILFRRNRRAVLLGLNGAGKTTLFLHCNGIFRPQKGQVLYNSSPLDYSRQGLRELRSRVGLVFQNPDSQLFSASVREDISFGPMNLGLERHEVCTRVEQALEAVGMTDYAGKAVHNLSYGQKKRVCIAGVLAMQPELLILDEPFAGLDVSMQTELNLILDQLHEQGITIILATHDIDFAYQWADDICVLVQGTCKAVWDGLQNPQQLEQFVAHGFGMPRVAQLYYSLVQSGLLASSQAIPRSHQELLNLIHG